MSLGVLSAGWDKEASVGWLDYVEQDRRNREAERLLRAAPVNKWLPWALTRVGFIHYRLAENEAAMRCFEESFRWRSRSNGGEASI